MSLARLGSVDTRTIIDRKPGGRRAIDGRAVAEDLTNFLVQSIERARDRAVPFYHLEFDRVFPEDVYAALLREMPDDNDYRALRGRHDENLLDDGSSTRITIDLL